MTHTPAPTGRLTNGHPQTRHTIAFPCTQPVLQAMAKRSASLARAMLVEAVLHGESLPPLAWRFTKHATPEPAPAAWGSQETSLSLLAGSQRAVAIPPKSRGLSITSSLVYTRVPISFKQQTRSPRWAALRGSTSCDVRGLKGAGLVFYLVLAVVVTRLGLLVGASQEPGTGAAQRRERSCSTHVPPLLSSVCLPPSLL